jgi:hypothetical protein
MNSSFAAPAQDRVQRSVHRSSADVDEAGDRRVLRLGLIVRS